MLSRRGVLRAGCSLALAASVAGCSGTESTATRIGDVTVGNRQDRPNTVHLLVRHEGDIVLWRSYDFEAASDDPYVAAPGVTIEDVPPEWTDCRVHARLNDEETAGIDLGEYDVACTYLTVEAMPADAGGGLSIFHSTSCE